MKWASRQVLRWWRVEATDAVKTVLPDAEEHDRTTGALALPCSGTPGRAAGRRLTGVVTLDDVLASIVGR
ncbi:hypothetical protein ACFFKH_25175 [Micromonospora marina]|uniref:CBS domain-containing protein n=1 Tax=Micromonospora marina TaxID=307120 RepID=A0A1C4UU26_9ACTN|nr:hypothetical protein [Micromonospora marina]SCE75194.1 hypothetical protein GA0070215_102162 [Micromonospora marina]